MSSFLEFNLGADHLTFEWWYGSFCLCIIFFPKPLVIEFLLTNNDVRFSSSIIRLEIYIFVSEGIFFASYFLGRIFFPQNQSTGYFFSEITHTPLKSQMVGPLWFINYQCKTSQLIIITSSLGNPYFQFISPQEEYEIRGAVLAQALSP